MSKRRKGRAKSRYRQVDVVYVNLLNVAEIGEFAPPRYHADPGHVAHTTVNGRGCVARLHGKR